MNGKLLPELDARNVKDELLPIMASSCSFLCNTNNLLSHQQIHVLKTIFDIETDVPIFKNVRDNLKNIQLSAKELYTDFINEHHVEAKFTAS